MTAVSTTQAIAEAWLESHGWEPVGKKRKRWIGHAIMDKTPLPYALALEIAIANAIRYDNFIPPIRDPR